MKAALGTMEIAMICMVLATAIVIAGLTIYSSLP